MNSFDDETRHRLATGWDRRVSTLREYARQNGVSERALRNWRSRFAQEGEQPVPPRRADLPLHAAVDALQAKLTALGAVVDALQAKLTALGAAVDSVHAALAAARAVLEAASPPIELADEAAHQDENRSPPVATAEVVPAMQCEPQAGAVTTTRPAKRKSFFLDFD